MQACIQGDKTRYAGFEGKSGRECKEFLLDKIVLSQECGNSGMQESQKKTRRTWRAVRSLAGIMEFERGMHAHRGHC